MPGAGGQNLIETRIGGVGGGFRAIEHDPNTDDTILRRPVGYRLGHPWIGRVERLDQPEPAGMLRMHFESVAAVEAIHGVGRDQQRTVDADGVHGRHHVVARDLRRSVQKARPGAAGVVALVGVHLGVYRDHDSQPFI